MSGKMQWIDLDTWPRREHFALYHGMDYPQFNLCMNLDVTNFLAFVERSGISFYYAMCFASVRAANQFDEFRYRIRGERVVLHERVRPSFTDLEEGSDLFKIVTMDMGDDLIAFTREAAARSKAQTCFLDAREQEWDDLIYITCVPWVSFTQLTHPIALNRDDSIPRISWGKYFPQNGKILLPFSIQANHALMDGFQVGKYAAQLQRDLDGFCTI